MDLDQNNNNLMFEMFTILQKQDPSAVRRVLELLYNGVMKLERQSHLGVEPYERSDDRQDHANGYKDKKYKTRMGSLDLKVPQTRRTDFYPLCLTRGTRAERALIISIAEMYFKGVSTRKVAAITKQLCDLEISSSQVSAMAKELDEEFEDFRTRPLGECPYVYLDATYVKVRHSGSVISMATLIAFGVNTEGKREILGISASLSEAEVHWRAFLESLLQRGLKGVQLVIGDDHAGLTSALQCVLPAVPRQRCQFHMFQNAQNYAPKKSMIKDIVGAMKRIFHSPDRTSAEETKRLTIKKFEKKAPEFARWFETNIDEGLTCLAFPEEHRKRIRTTNGLERVNREVKRRTRVATLFPNPESALWLVTGVLIGIHEEWMTGRAYLDMSHLKDMQRARE